MYPKVIALCQAIQKYEGMDPACHNPMALRWSPYETGQKCYPGKGCFAYFDTDVEGFNAGIHQVLIVCKGMSNAYNLPARALGLPDCSQMTLLQFMGVYSPASDNNLPDKYAAWLSQETGIPVDATMGSLIAQTDITNNS